MCFQLPAGTEYRRALGQVALPGDHMATRYEQAAARDLGCAIFAVICHELRHPFAVPGHKPRTQACVQLGMPMAGSDPNQRNGNRAPTLWFRNRDLRLVDNRTVFAQPVSKGTTRWTS